MNSATISADVISYTSLPEKDKRKLNDKIKELLIFRGKPPIKAMEQPFGTTTYFTLLPMPQSGFCTSIPIPQDYHVFC